MIFDGLHLRQIPQAEFGSRRRGRGRSHLRTGNRKIAIDLSEDKLRSSFTLFFWVCFLPWRVLTTIPEKKYLGHLSWNVSPASPDQCWKCCVLFLWNKKGKKGRTWTCLVSQQFCKGLPDDLNCAAHFPSSLDEKLEVKNLVGCERWVRVFRIAGKRYTTEKNRKKVQSKSKLEWRILSLVMSLKRHRLFSTGFLFLNLNIRISR